MCSSPKSNGCYVPPKKPTRSILAGFSAEQRRSFAAAANQAQERKKRRLQAQNRHTRALSPARHLHGNVVSRKNSLHLWSAFIAKLTSTLDWSKWWPAREL